LSLRVALRLSSPWLDPTKELPVTNANNPMWHGILQPSEAKYTTWLRRVGGRFQAKIEEQLSKGKMPNLRNYASQYRDSEPELVYRMACLWEHGRLDVMRLHSRLRAAELEAMFFRGALDRDMIDKVRVLDPSFVFVDSLRFMRDVEADPNAQLPVDELCAAEAQKQVADFKLFRIRLQTEQNEWRRYTVARREWDESAQAELTMYREAVHDSLVAAVREHMATCFQADCTATFETRELYCESAIKTFADSPGVQCRVEDVLRLNVYNLAMQGASHSRVLKDTVGTIKSETAHHPKTSVSVVILPNTPAWGDGGERWVPAYNRLVSNARAAVLSALAEECNEVVVQECVAMFDATGFQKSPDRELRLDFALVVSNKREEGEGGLESPWTQSVLWRRRAVPQIVSAMPRASFRDWSKQMVAYDRGNMDGAQERRQWASGHQLYMAIIESLLQDVGTSNRFVHVRDHTLYDDELGLAVLTHRAKQKGLGHCLGYAGATWKAAMAGANIAAYNVNTSLEEHIIRMSKDGTYIVPGVRSLGAEPKPNETTRPSLAEEKFVVCAPRANESLPLRQTFLDEWSSAKARFALRDTF